MKYFAVSDIHDHYDLMAAALKNNGFDRENPNHKLIICGDAFYSGPQPGEMYEFMKELHEKGRLVFVRGNHDVELLNYLKTGRIGREGNRVCTQLLVKYLTGKENLSDKELVDECKAVGFTDFLEKVPVWYFETDHYIFTHGFIPTDRNNYIPDWRNSTDKEWNTAAARGDAMKLSMYYHVSEPNKIIVCGHYSCARCYKMKNASEKDWENKIYTNVKDVPREGFKTFMGGTFIDLDQSVKKTGFVNCLVISD